MRKLIHLILILNILTLFNISNAALSDVDKAQVMFGQELKNPGFENGLADWSVSGGTLALATSDSSFGMGKRYATWNSNGASQTLQSTLNAIPGYLAYASVNAEAFCYFQTPSGTSTHTFKVVNNSGTTLGASTTIISTNLSAKVAVIPFAVTDASSWRVVITSVASDEPSISVDGCYLGPAVSVGSGSLASDWTSYGTTSDFTGFGTVTNIALFYRRIGDSIEIRGKFTAGTTTATEARIAFPSGLTSASSTYIPTVTTAGNFYRGATSDNQMNVLMEPSVAYVTFSSNTISSNPHTKANANTVLGTGEAGMFQARVPINGWRGNGTTYTTDQADYGWTAYTPTLGAGFGTATNISFFHKRVGDTLVVKGSFTVGTAAASASTITLPNSLVIDTAKISIANTSGNPGPHVGDYENSEAVANTAGVIVTATGTSTSLVYFGSSETNAASALTPANGTSVTASSAVVSVNFSLPISGWANTNRAPQLVNSVINSSSGVSSIEAANINCDSGSAITAQHGNWVTSVGNVSAGACVVTINTGIFSAAPYCTVASRGLADPSTVLSITAASSTSLTVDCDGVAGTDCTAYDYYLQCVGAK